MNMKEFFKWLKNNIGDMNISNICVKVINEWIKLKLKVIKKQLDINFMKNCLYNKIIPKFLKIEVIKNIFDVKYVLRLQTKLIIKYIRVLYREKEELLRRVKNIYERLRTLINLKEEIILRDIFIYRMGIFKDKVNLRHNRKIERLIKNRNKENIYENKNGDKNKGKNKNKGYDINNNKKKFIINLTDRIFKENEIQILEKGLKYIPSKKINVQKEIFEIEAKCKLVVDKLKDINNFNSSNEKKKNGFEMMVKEFQYRMEELEYDMKGNKEGKYVNRDEWEVIMNMRSKYKDVLFLKGDKTSSMVVMMKEEYMEKMEILLREDCFERIKKNEGIEKNKRINRIITEMYLKGNIAKLDLIKLKRMDFRNAVIHGIPKTHKIGIPLRPIINNVDTYYEKISKWLFNKILKKYGEKKKQNNVSNSNEFIKRLKMFLERNGNIKNMCFVKFDICNMYTNIDPSKAFEIIMEMYIRDDNKNIKIECNMLHDILSICCKDVVFVHNEIYYKQCKGLSMGNCLSGLLASLYMNYFEESFFNRTKYKPIFYVRYVDDYFLVFNGNDRKSEYFLRYINSINANIKFTMEREIDNSIEYMDVRVTKIIKNYKVKIETNVFRKDTFYGLLTNWKSDIEYIHKINIVNNRIIRGINLCSEEKLFKEEMGKIKEEAIKNDYPVKIINKLCGKKNIEKIKMRLNKNKEKKNFMFSSYKVSKRTFFKIKKIMKDINRKYGEECNLMLKPVYKRKCNLGNVIKETRNRNVENMNGIYRIECLDCKKDNKNVSYIGTTKNKLGTRLKQHLNDKNSNVYIHSKEFGHVDFEIKMLEKVKLYRERMVKESLYIKRNKPVLNRIN